MNNLSNRFFLLFLVGILYSGFALADLSELADRLKKSLVSITALNDGMPFATGSGFVIAENGIFATNHHVIEGANGLVIKLDNGETYERVDVLGIDARRDLAVLKIPAVGLPALPFAPIDSADVGDDIYVIGNPLGLEATFSTGIVSAERLWDGVQMLQITAPISSGSSGGPIVNREGQVIGVSTAGMDEGQNLNFAVPAKHVQGLLDSAGQPVPIAEFAAANWPQSAAPAAGPATAEGGGEIAPWVLEQAAEIGYDLEPILPQLVVMNFPEQEVAFQMRLQVEQLAEAGYAWIDLFQMGTADEEGALMLAAELPEGDYVAFGVCDSDCGDIDLGILDAQGEMIVLDEEEDAYPMVEFSLPSQQPVTAVLREFSCDVAPCYHLVSVLQYIGDTQAAPRKFYGPFDPPG